ncbi:class C sortase [Leifsonia sp. NPDC077715]|uniref:class C sortase n=1 Tax=Leifsonia sp. NPDC077715 TaxID=3155539 RepID=UPI003429BEBC
MPRSTKRAARTGRRWRPSFVLILTAILGVIGSGTLTYSPAASWFNDYNQSLVISTYSDSIRDADPSATEQLEQAKAYNDALSAGALIEANTNVPTGAGTSSDDKLDYWRMLRTPTDAMSRIQVPKVGIDLPVYHGTSEASLLRGAGHLQGTSLPVGGKDTHSVITAHRGLADSTMFTDLDKVGVGDRFIITTFGKVLTYQVTDTKVVEPSDSSSLRQEAGRDLVTLVTCTPLGINTHRILVTGKRITPTPARDLDTANKTAATLSFPWWAVAFLGALVLIGLYTWWGGRLRGRPGSGGGRGRVGEQISYTFTATRMGASPPSGTAARSTGLAPLTYRWPHSPGTLQPGQQVTAWTGDRATGRGGAEQLLVGGFVFTVTNTGETTMHGVDIARGLPGLDSLASDWAAALAPLPPGQTATADVKHQLTEADCTAAEPASGAPKNKRGRRAGRGRRRARPKDAAV